MATEEGTLKPSTDLTNRVNDAIEGISVGRTSPLRMFATFDSRLYRKLTLHDSSTGSVLVNDIYPHYTYVNTDKNSSEFKSVVNTQSYVTDFYESIKSIDRDIADASTDEEKKVLQERKKYIEAFNEKYKDSYIGHRSFIHPYAIVKLTGASGSPATTKLNLTYDEWWKRRYYEIDGDLVAGTNYSKSPTTTTLIKWGNQSHRGTAPYSFQDFIFCKWWNKMENNRLITLRRYAMPVTDYVEFPDYEVEEATSAADENRAVYDVSGGKRFMGRNSDSAWVPLATAVTYFGEGTGNDLSNILSFSAKYNWEEISANKNPTDVNTVQADAGTGLQGLTSQTGIVTKGLSGMIKVLGFMGEVAGKNTIDPTYAAANMPPDPYSNGPYMNRILGPVNVISNTWKRGRGLTFKGDGLNIKFDYVARPIAGVNSKAVLLDLLANMLVLTYSSGTWFGGMLRYRVDKPAMYPFKYGDAMSKLYQGKLFGKDSAVASLFKEATNDGKDLTTATALLPDFFGSMSNILSGAVNMFKGVFGIGGAGKETIDEGRNQINAGLESNTAKAIGKVIAAKVIAGSTIPYIQNQRALLTGEPVGDWHLTIGNPLNPIALIGNLIVTDTKIEFSNELGPDDFPIGFSATVTLQHGMGRDRDAIESMFNRGGGRIYSLSKAFRSSADHETRVDEFTGRGDAIDGNRKTYDETRNMFFGGGRAFIFDKNESPLKNKGSIVFDGDTAHMEGLSPHNTSKDSNNMIMANYFVNPWQMGYSM